ncbi:VOC family protein [Saccharopolyspora taberi]|uniref:VOC family protein n=1 Tax=Saccharopolyspora taberi TaxID=60895 RepID=A0ABN3VGP6_9PSEU
MATRLNPYISFPGTARQAMEYYQHVFGGSLSLRTYGEFGAQEQGEQIMHSMLETERGFTLMASDSPDQSEHRPGNNISISVTGDGADSEELRGYWDKLADGGTVSVPLEKQMWGDYFGMCTDKFGITWMIDFGE